MPITKSAWASTSLLFTFITPGPLITDSPGRSVTSTRYFPGFTLNVKPPVELVVSAWLSPVSTLMTRTERLAIALVPAGPLTIPLIVPFGDAGFGAVSITGTPGRQPPIISSTASPAARHATDSHRGQKVVIGEDMTALPDDGRRVPEDHRPPVAVFRRRRSAVQQP